MIRTQIYLTDRQRAELASISKALGKKQSELIREAVDRLIDQAGHSRREVVLREQHPFAKLELPQPVGGRTAQFQPVAPWPGPAAAFGNLSEGCLPAVWAW